MARRSVSVPGLRDYQADVYNSLLRALPQHPADTFTVMFPRQTGKNEVAAAVVAALMVAAATRGGSVVVCAPSYRPQARISLERLRRRLAAHAVLHPAEVGVTVSGNVVSYGAATATFLSASPEASVAGHTASLLLVGDEAQDIDEETFDRQFRPMAASTAAPTVLFGTAWDGHSLLEDHAARNREGDARQAATTGYLPLHYQVSWERAAECVPAYGEYVRRERERMGADHPLFLSQYELVPARGAGRLLNAGQLARLEGTHSRLEGPVDGERYVAGLDLAGEGESGDRSVLTIGRVAGPRCEVVAHAAWRGEAYDQLQGALLALLSQWRVEMVSADASGLGAPVVSALRKSLGARVDGVTFTGALKSGLGYGLIAAASTGSLTLYAPDGSADATRLRNELRACRSGLRPGGGLWWSAPTGEHDDYIVSLALCLRAAESLGPARVARGRGRNED